MLDELYMSAAVATAAVTLDENDDVKCSVKH